jgi:C1A family cysteine protease
MELNLPNKDLPEIKKKEFDRDYDDEDTDTDSDEDNKSDWEGILLKIKCPYCGTRMIKRINYPYGKNSKGVVTFSCRQCRKTS